MNMQKKRYSGIQGTEKRCKKGMTQPKIFGFTDGFSVLMYFLPCSVFYNIFFMMIIDMWVRYSTYTLYKLTTWTQIINANIDFTFRFCFFGSVLVISSFLIIFERFILRKSKNLFIFIFIRNRNIQFLKVNVKENDKNTTIILR